jgi:hypothetical protein
MGTLDLERPTPSTGCAAAGLTRLNGHSIAAWATSDAAAANTCRQKYDELLSMPGDMMCAEAAAIPRATCQYTPRVRHNTLAKLLILS